MSLSLINFNTFAVNRRKFMKHLFFILLTAWSFSLKAQDSTKVSNNFLDIYYGYRPFFQAFNGQLNTTDKIELSTPLQLLGIRGCEDIHVGNRMRFYQHFTYNQVIPQPVYIHDTLKGNITGCVWGMGYGGLLKSSVVDLYYYLGFNTGRLRIYGNELIRQKNPFFSPKVGIQPRLKFGKIGITALIEYDYDISKTAWRRTLLANKDKVDIDRLRQTGITAQIGICFRMK